MEAKLHGAGKRIIGISDVEDVRHADKLVARQMCRFKGLEEDEGGRVRWVRCRCQRVAHLLLRAEAVLV